MKKLVFAVLFLFFSFVFTTINAQDVSVVNWYHPIEKDWVTIPGSTPTPAQLKSWGYTTSTPVLYFGSSVRKDGMIAIYRWYHPTEKDWVTLPETYGTDAKLTSFGYQSKSFAFYAYPNQQPGTVLVSLWYHAQEKDYVSLPEGYSSDADLIKGGYVKSANGFFYAFPSNNSKFSQSSSNIITRPHNFNFEALLTTFTKKSGSTTLTISKKTSNYTPLQASNQIVSASNYEIDPSNSSVACRTETRKYSAENMDQDILNPDAIANLRIGGVYDLTKMQAGNYMNETTNRQPISVYLSDASNNAITVNNPTDLSLQQALDQVRNKPFNYTPSSKGAFLSTTQVTSTESLNAAVGISFTGYGLDASNKFSYNKNSSANKFLLSYTNATYTAFANPTNGTIFTDEIQNKNSSLVYIDKITYGIKLMVYFEGNISEEEIKNNFAMSGYGLKGNFDLEIKNRLNNINYKIYLYGSNQALFIPSINGYDAMIAKVNELLKNLSIDGKTYPTTMGQPISYSLKFLDGGVAVTSCKVEDIPQRICGPNPNMPLDFSLNLDGLQFTGGNTFGWIDAEIIDGNGRRVNIQPVWKVDRDQAVYQSIQPNPQSPYLKLIFRGITKDVRTNGKLRIWTRAQNREIGGTDRFLTLANNNNFDMANNGLHSGFKGQYTDFDLKSFLAKSPGGSAKQEKVSIANQDKSLTATFSGMFNFN